jgi:DNA polymerase-3 subunit epsilon
MNFVALDFETATDERSSICEAGLTFVENGKITRTLSWLVKPKDNEYDFFNIMIHGIKPEDTADKPAFDKLWKEIRPLLDGKTVTAHNAAFDMYALRDVLNLYGLEYPNIKTFCSCTLAKRAIPGLLSYSLEPVCNHLNIELNNHHRAGDDSKACAEICLRIFEQGDISDLSTLKDAYRILFGAMSSETNSYSGPSSKHKPKDNPIITGDASKNDPDSLFHGKTVVFTGTLSSMTRNQAKQIIADIGGFSENDITQRTNFLVVGQQDFRVVGESGLSGKQKKALQLLQKGQEIEIMSELDFRQNIQSTHL